MTLHWLIIAEVKNLNLNYLALCKVGIFFGLLIREEPVLTIIIRPAERKCSELRRSITNWPAKKDWVGYRAR